MAYTRTHSCQMHISSCWECMCVRHTFGTDEFPFKPQMDDLAQAAARQRQRCRTGHECMQHFGVGGGNGISGISAIHPALSISITLLMHNIGQTGMGARKPRHEFQQILWAAIAAVFLTLPMIKPNKQNSEKKEPCSNEPRTSTPFTLTHTLTCEHTLTNRHTNIQKNALPYL